MVITVYVSYVTDALRIGILVQSNCRLLFWRKCLRLHLALVPLYLALLVIAFWEEEKAELSGIRLNLNHGGNKTDGIALTIDNDTDFNFRFKV